MTRRPIQQARRITDRRQFLGDWPERETYIWSPSRATRVDVKEIVVGVLAMTPVFLAVVVWMIWAGTR